MSNTTTPSYLSLLEEETNYVKDTAVTSKVRRVSIPVGHTWLLRFLPVEMGPRKSFFARHSNHWINKRPTPCIRHTSPDFGGDPHAPCELCDVSAELNAHGSKAVSTVGYRASAVDQWLLFCLVFEKEDGRDSVIMSPDQSLEAYECNLTRSSWEDFSAIFKKGVRRNPMSVLDLLEGNDFWCSQKKNGWRFQAEPSAPIVTGDDAQVQKAIERIWSSIKLPSIKFPSSRELQDAADKLRDAAFSGSDSSRGDYRRDDEVADYGRHSRGRAEEHSFRSRSDDAPRGRNDDETRGDDDEAPRHSRRSEDTTPAPSRSSRANDESSRDPVQGDDGNLPPSRVSSVVPPSVTRRLAPPPAAATGGVPAPQLAHHEAPREAPAAPRSGSLPPPPARGTSGAREESIDDDEVVPAEKVDLAPPAAMPEPAPAPKTQDAPPPPVTAVGASPTPPRLSSRIRAGIKSVDTRE